MHWPPSHSVGADLRKTATRSVEDAEVAGGRVGLTASTGTLNGGGIGR